MTDYSSGTGGIAGTKMEELAPSGNTPETSAHGAHCSAKLASMQDMEQIWTWNNIVPRPVDQFAHELIEKIVQSQPNSLAICAHDGELSYVELNDLASRLAGRLIDAEIVEGQIIPLCFEKSKWTAVAILAVLKAGGAFVLLDPSLPEQRLGTIVEEVGGKVILTGATTEFLSLRLSKTVIKVDQDSLNCLNSAILQRRTDGLESASRPMYVIFTSGSTGTPKGVLISHSNFCSAFQNQSTELGFTKKSRVFDFASYAFDISILNVLATLLAGGCICVPSEKDRKDNIGMAMLSMQVNISILTPTVARLLDPAQLPCLERLILIGEPVSAEDAKPWLDRVTLINAYGPSECPLASTINTNSTSLQEAILIGKGAGLATWVVDQDDHNRLAPLGCVGELLIEGPAIGLGYLNRPEQTAQVFIENPLWLQKGTQSRQGRPGRLYKTGDLVQYQSDGMLKYIGRKDFQIKIRGQRVELGEIECAIRQHVANIGQALVDMISPGGSKAQSRLVAFIEMNNKDRSHGVDVKNVPGLRIFEVAPEEASQLAKRLPAYMVPTAFFALDQLPLTPSGKTYRKGLRDLGAKLSAQQLAEARTGGGAAKRQPTTEAESILRKIWAHELGISPSSIGLDDNFFHLGGNSVSAIKVVGTYRKMGLVVSAADIFRSPTLHRVASQARPVVKTVNISPFSLMGPECDIRSLLGQISAQHHLQEKHVQDVFPCTSLQEGLMSLTFKQPGDYILQAVMKLETNVDVATFRNAWSEVAQKMPILRTRIVQHNDHGLLQIVLDEEIRWLEDIGLNSYLENDKHQPMDIGTPLVRYALVRDDYGDVGSWFVWTVHHALFDGWSLFLVTDYVTRAYIGQSISQGPQFQSFVKYVQDLHMSQEACEYWRTALDDCEAVPFPPPPPSSGQSAAHSTIEHGIDYPKMQQSTGVTIPTLVRAAWALIAGQMTNSSDVVFGVTVSGRQGSVASIEEIAGPTIATVPFRVRLPQDMAIQSYLQGVHRQATEMVPFEQTGLQRIAKMSSDCQQACMFQTLLLVQPDQKTWDTDGILGQWQNGGQAVKFNTYALILEIFLKPQGITAKATFCSSVIEPWMVKLLLERLGHTMQCLARADPSAELSTIQLATPRDMEQIWSWNRILPKPVEERVHDIISSWAKERGNSPAICAWDGSLTYVQLDTLASILSRRLLDNGLSPGDLVPLCFEKSMWSAVAMLAVAKAGGAFVLLDTSLPKQRLQMIVDQTDSGLLISSIAAMHLSSSISRHRTVLSVGPELNEQANKTCPIPSNGQSVSPASTLFAVFTSGSTGTPKGTLITHSNFCSGVYHQATRLGFFKDARVFDFASHAFDAAVHNVFATFLTGGCVCIPSEADRRDRLATSLVSMRATMAILTPTVARLLNPAKLPDLKTLVLCGEALSIQDALPWWGRVQVINGYGPSECTVASTINDHASTPEEITNIGKGVGLVTWVVDPENHNRLLPPGCVGELLLEGPLVGKGYLNEPEKTAAAFIHDPAWLLEGTKDRPGRCGRLYKSGDLVQYNQDGSLRFAGRKDGQVKIRGQRVELGEIERKVQGCMPNICQVAVEPITPRCEDGSSKTTLAAFFVPKELPPNKSDVLTPTISPIPQDVEAMLAERLPRYMIPTAAFSMTELPLNATGKTNRKHLREIGASFTWQELVDTQSAARGPKRQPKSQRCQLLQNIFAKVLCIDPATIGLDDNFFQLGGDSIAAMKVAAEARKAGIELAIGDIFRHSTLGSISEHTSSALRHGQLEEAAVIDSNKRSALLEVIDSLGIDMTSERILDILPVTNMQELYISDSIKSGRFCNYFYCDFSGMLDLTRLEASWISALEHFPILRSCFLPLRGEYWQIVPCQTKLSLEVLEATESMDALFHSLCLEDSKRFEPHQPPFKITVLKGAQRIRMILRISHAQYDAISLPVVLRFFCAHYDGKPCPPIVHFSRFLSYTSRQRSMSCAYWKSFLRGSSPTTLPMNVGQAGTSRDSKPTRIQASVKMDLPILPGSITVANVITASWGLLLSQITGKTDIAFGQIVAGRNSAIDGIEEIPGPCTNLIPVRMITSPSQPFLSLLHQVQKQFMDLGEADSLGYKEIAEHCTDWPGGMDFEWPSIIKHQNIDTHPEIEISGNRSRIDFFHNSDVVPSSAVKMTSYPEGRYIRCSLLTNSSRMTTEAANELLSALKVIILQMGACTKG